MKLMIIGIDSMDPRILFSNINKFPNMKKLCEKGAYSAYDTYAYGYGSLDNWISLYTGLSPKQHGVIDNQDSNTNMQPNYNNYKDKKPFWKLLNEKNLKVATWKGFLTSPGEKINGYMVTGEINYEFNGSKINYENMGLKFHEEDEHIYHKCIKDDIGYPIPPRKPSDYGLTWERLFEENYLADKILEKDNYYEDGYLYLKKELNYYKKNIINTQIHYPTDILFYYVQTLDLIQHFQSYDTNKRIIIESMKLLDKFIGDLMNEINPENIIVISDHGISSFRDVLNSNDINIQKEAFGWREQSIWLRNGEIITKARNGGLLNGFHDIKGTFIISGKGIKKKNIEEMRTLDFYPTLLELFDIEVPEGRDGYILDIFNKRNFKNKNRLLNSEAIKYREVAIIQNLGVPEFNSVINEVFLDNRFCEITLFCEAKYKSIFESNTRLNSVIDIRDVEINTEFHKKFDSVFIGYQNDSTKEVSYIKLRIT